MVDVTVASERRDFYVYVIFRTNGVPCYVGKGSGKRAFTHQTQCHNRQLAALLRESKNSGRYLPTVIVRGGMTETEAFETEIAFIGAIGRGSRGPLVNWTDGGEGTVGFVHSLESRARMSAAKAGGTHASPSEETRRKISEAQKGKFISPDARAKMSVARRNRSAEVELRAAESRKGKIVHSAETRAKMSQTRKGMVRSASHCAALSASQKGKARPSPSIETLAKRSLALKGKPWTEARRLAEQSRRARPNPGPEPL